MAATESHLVFWSRQLSEHALFLQLGMEVEPYKSEGAELHQIWEDFRATFPNNPQFMGDAQTIARFNQLADVLKEYKLDILTAMTACVENTDANPQTTLGWIFPLFAEHIIRELNYAKAKVNGLEISIEEEINFWRLINKEHALFAAHLLDPSERDLIRIANALADKIAADETCESKLFVRISLQYAKELDNYTNKAKTLMNSNQLRSVIHPVLLTHVIREGQRSIATLQAIKEEYGGDLAVFVRDDILDDYIDYECEKGKGSKC